MDKAKLLYSLFAILLIGAVVYLLFVYEPEDDIDNGAENDTVEYLSLIDLERNPSLGDENAPVVMVNYSSYYCQFCSSFKQNIFPEIKENYIDTGKVFYVYKDAGSPSDPVFVAPHCALAEGKFWDFQDIIIQKGIQSEEDLYTYADELGLDPDAFKKCLSSGDYDDVINLAQEEMTKLEVEGIPYFIINNRVAVGIASFEEASKIIEEELSKKGI